MWVRVFWAVVLLALGAMILIGILIGHMRLRAPGRLTALYRRHFDVSRRERLFLASIAFFVTFVTVRSVTHAIRAGIGGFRNVSAGGIHIHHLVWGVLLLLAVGYAWLVEIGIGTDPASRWASRATALLYGIGAALTLDEFALWLRLEDVYWTREGRESIEAVLLFGGLLSVGLWGAAFLRSLVSETTRIFGR
jgi:hypothetical protein